MAKRKSISDQVIVITGASSGIGLATATMAAQKGARVVIASRNTAELEKIAAGLSEDGGRIFAVTTDVTKMRDLENLRDQAVKKFGRIDTWVNNAGTSIYGSLLDEPLEDEKQLFETNFWGIRMGSQVAVQALKKNGGTLINLGSEVSGRSIPVQGMYSATKHAVKAFTDALRMEIEHAELPIFVSLIRPTAINTPFPEHATNHLKEGTPALPAPTYHPDVVAEAILTCAESPQRDVFVGGQSRLMNVLDTFFPRMMDHMMEGMMFDAQSAGSKVPHKSKNEALHHPPPREGKILGAAKGKMRTNSIYTSSAQRPWRTLAFAGAALALGGFVAKAASEHEQKNEKRVS